MEGPIGEKNKPLIIINADDYCISEKVSLGILEALGSGSVTTTSVIVNMPCFEKMAAAIKGASFDCGLHLNLTAGKPVSDSKLMSSQDGAFRSLNWFLGQYFLGRLEAVAIEKEISAQFAKFIAFFGRLPSHVDSHHHVHMFHPVWGIVRRLMLKYNIAFLRNSVDFSGPGSVKNYLLKRCSSDNNFNGLRKIPFTGHSLLGLQRVMKLPDPPHGVKCFEWMVHCGYNDPQLGSFDGYIVPRPIELEFLNRLDTLEEIRKRFIPVSFGSLDSAAANPINSKSGT